MFREDLIARKQRKLKHHLDAINQSNADIITATDDSIDVSMPQLSLSNSSMALHATGYSSTISLPSHANEVRTTQTKADRGSNKHSTNAVYKRSHDNKIKPIKRRDTTSTSRVSNFTQSSATRNHTGNSVNNFTASAAHPPSSPSPQAPRRKRRYHRGRRKRKPKPGSINNYKTVINLSDRDLPQHERSILSKRLKFVPTPTNINKTKLIADVKNWTRRMRLKEFFWNDNSTQLEKESSYKKPSSWTPNKSRDLILDCYLSAVESSILQTSYNNNNNTQHSNITKEERNAIKTLKQDKNIVIFQADKGAAVVIQNRSDYLNEAYKQLNGKDENNEEVYRLLPSDPSYDFQERVKVVVREALTKGVINDGTANFLVVANVRTANIYFLPKIHKPQRPPPARPICNTINSPTANISKWVDDQLQPLVKKLPSYLKDDNDFLRKLVEINNTETLPPETLLVSWDVKSLYTNIPHASGMGACEYYMRAHGFNEDKISIILRFVNLVLTCNNLTFQGNHFVQRTGTAMGTKMAPTYANLFMGHLEEQLL